ncbi:MAG: GspE/PulE family protein [Burkholderiales bacterium]|nr:GspE/PulE family protein [Burkholderiales bacterium]
MIARTIPDPEALAASSAELRELLARHGAGGQPHLGSMLVERGLITPADLRACLEAQRAEPEHRRLGEMLVERGLIRAAERDEALVDLVGIPRVDLARFDYDAAALYALPPEFVRSHNVLPLARRGDELVVATSEPLDAAHVERLRFAAQRPVVPVYAPAEAISAAIEVAYAAQIEDEDLRKIAHALGEREGGEDEHGLWQEAERLASREPVVRLVNGLVSEAVLLRASDIHVRPRAHSVEVLFRIDGSLVHMRELARTLLPALVSRIKIMSRLNIAERRIPQDGHASAIVGGARVDLRVSTLPTRFGESVVIRVLNRQNVVRSLDEIGLKPADERLLRDLLDRSHGLVLVTGPTGSGKTTTLYAALRELARANLNIVTVEDPVEYELSGVRQIQVQPQIEFGFARALRHILRHDPDVIMVGEMRDAETCRIAVESALTGHLVLATLHTNDAPSTVVRLVEIGVEPYLIESAVTGVLAQRLVRRNCPHCLVEETPDPFLRQRLGVAAEEKFWRGRGCAHCHDTGFAGRTAIYELMAVGPEIRAAVRAGASAEALRAAALRAGMVPLLANGLELARAKAASLAEVYRACA